MALLVSLFADFIQGEIEELDRILNILDPRSSTLDLPSLRQLIVERQSVAVAARESIFEEWSGGDLPPASSSAIPPRGRRRRRPRRGASPLDQVPRRLRRRINFN